MAVKSLYVYNQLLCLFIFTILTLSIGYKDPVYADKSEYTVIDRTEDSSLHIQNILHRDKRQTTNNGSTPSTTTPPQFQQDIHKYYSVQYFLDGNQNQWVDLDSITEAVKVTHSTLSDSHKTAATVKLSFDFTYYGHTVKQVTIATGGFLYMSNFLHQWLTATQYIAPLMANFDLKLGQQSFVHYLDNKTHFVCQWENVMLQDFQNAGHFDFQVVLAADGRIWFNYKVIPVGLDSIGQEAHPVKVGLSDAYYIDSATPGSSVKRRTIYEYHRVEIMKNYVSSQTTIYIIPLQTCIVQKDCWSCMTADLPTFDCRWCEDLSRCSDGLDRYRQDWLKQGCHNSVINLPSKCPRSTTVNSITPTSLTTTKTHETTVKTTKNITATTTYQVNPRFDKTTKLSTEPNHEVSTPKTTSKTHENTRPATETTVKTTKNITATTTYQEVKQTGHCQTGLHPGLIALIVIVILAVIIAVVIWVVYAYRNPNSSSGRWMIEHRPSELKRKMQNMKVNFMNRGETGDKYAVSVGQGNETTA